MSAVIPAVAYFGSVFILVDLLARKNTFTHPERKVKSEDLKFEVAPILPRLYLLLPAILLVVMVMSGQSLRRSAMISTVAVLVLNLIPGRGVSFKELLQAFQDGIKPVSYTLLWPRRFDFGKGSCQSLFDGALFV